MLKKVSLVGLFSCLSLLVGCGVTIQPIDNAGRSNAPRESSVQMESLPAAVEANPEVIHGTAVDPEAASDAFILKALDPIYVSFSGVRDQQSQDMNIDEYGEISLLHLDKPVKAAGLSPSQLAKEIERRYKEAKIYRNIAVNITMTSKVYYVQGEVQAPGQFQLTSGTTLWQAIAGARGYTAFADMKKVSIMRNGKIAGIYNMKEIEKDPSKDVKIRAGDIIKVKQAIW